MDWTTWSPFQSDGVRQNGAHMTNSEQTSAMWRSGLYGLWVGATLAIPGGVIVFALVGNPRSTVVGAIVGICIALILVHIACIPYWLHMQRRFLCSTNWAREQGLRPADFHLFASRSR